MKRQTFIICEIGINHLGQLDIAKKLIKIAKEVGANAVKFQKRNIYKVYSKEYLKQPRNDDNPFGWKTQEEQKLGLEFGEKEYDEIDKYCKRLNVLWFASPWDLDSVEFLKKYNLKYNKIASAMLTHTSLLEAVAKQRKYTFISTGMSTLEEIEKAVDIFKKYSCPYQLMHCNSSYPCPTEDLNLLCIDTLKRKFNCPVGYSGHSSGIMDAVIAVALGANAVEKHITLDRTLYGTDQSSSLEPQGLRKMIEYIEFTEEALGTGEKIVTDREKKIMAKLRRSFDY